MPDETIANVFLRALFLVLVVGGEVEKGEVLVAAVVAVVAVVVVAVAVAVAPAEESTTDDG